MSDTARPDPRPRGLRPLMSLNFFMADMQAGIGPFLGVFLLAHGWQSGLIGTVMTVGGVAGMLMTAPAGALVDATRRKRLYVVVPGICTVAASALILLSQTVLARRGVAGRHRGWRAPPSARRSPGSRSAWCASAASTVRTAATRPSNHAGNVVGAGLSGLLGWTYGFTAVFWLAGLFGVLAIASALLIPAASIDDEAARGLDDTASGKGTGAGGLTVLLRSKPLLVLAAALACFHLGNGAMLPLYGLAVVAAKAGDPSLFVATTIVVAQAVMIGTSLLAMRMAEGRGYWLVLLISFVALPIRGLLAANMIDAWGVYPVQALDGIGAGLQSVAVPGLVARILDGTGRVNVGQGAVMTVQGLGASLSPAIGGWMAQSLG